MLYELYLITNKINHKRYVGQVVSTRGYLTRFKAHIAEAHYARHKNLLHAALLSYGEDAFDVKLLLKNIPEDKIDYYERLWIAKLNTFYRDGFGYNMTRGGQGIHGYHHTPESKVRITEYARSQWEELKDDPERLQQRNSKISKKLRGVTKSEATKRKCSEAAKKRFVTQPGTFKGKHHTAETRRTIALSRGQKVCMLDIKSGGVLKIFDTAIDATNYLITQGKTTNKYANTRILMVCDTSLTAYGYRWKRC